MNHTFWTKPVTDDERRVALRDAAHIERDVTIAGRTLPTCVLCGHVKSRDGWKSKCRGPVTVSLR